MLTKDINGKTFSNYFNSAISSYAQFVKPKITINLLESKHLSLTSNITNSDSYSSKPEGSRGYFFSEKQMINGYERETFPWAVTDALQKDGSIIKADGTWYVMPPTIDDDYEFGYWSNSKSQSNGVFASQPTITFPFQERKVNKIRIVTSEKYGQVKSFRVRVINANIGNILDETITFGDEEYFKDIYIKTNAAVSANFLASSITLNIISTKNGSDCARIHEVNPIYELDITDSVIDYSVSRSRDIHESSVPIGGTQSPKVTIKIDNTNKDWNMLSNSSLYGQYMKKDLKINVATGWRIKKTDEVILNTTLRSNLSNSSNSMSVIDNEIFPDDGVLNNFVVTINPDRQNREVILCSNTTGTYTVNIAQRGFNGTSANTHSAGSVVQFDPYEYVPMGTYYVDEWSASSSDMTVTVSASDWGKFMSEKTITKGFMMRNSTVGNAIKILTLMSNFPNGDFKILPTYEEGAIRNYAVASFPFSEQTIDRDGNLISLNGGLRIRLWGMRSSQEIFYKEILADALEKKLSIDERLKGVKEYTPSDASFLTTNISTSFGMETGAVFLNNYSFEGNDNVTYTKYFNGVIDGYYIPLTSGEQDIILDVQNGGARVYLDDTLISEKWKENTSLTTLSATSFLGNNLNLTAGVPYKIRIEFFHGPGDANFNLRLYKKLTASPTRSPITAQELQTTSARDSLGIRNASFLTSATDFNHHQNDGVYHANTELAQYSTGDGGTGNSVLLTDGAYIRIPNHSSIRLENKDFSYELVAKFHQSHFSSDGEYLSSWSNSNPNNGFEFYYNNDSTHGFKVKTTNGIEFVQTSNTTLSIGEFYHISVTYDSSSKVLKYYVNGVEKANKTIIGNIVTQTSDITIGGRGASFTSGIGKNDPAVTRELYIDDFGIYHNTLSSQDVLDRYLSLTVTKRRIFPFLYGNEKTIRELIDEISFAELGRFYIDEENKARYEHYKTFYEEIDQHYNVQHIIADSSNIIDAEYLVQLQANKVVVKVQSVATDLEGVQPLWRAEDPTTFATVNLEAEFDTNDTEMTVSTTTDPVFSNTGYLVINSEIIKYNSKTDTTFANIQRGQFNTTPATHAANTRVREARFFEITFDKSPAYSIKSPFITAMNDEEPDQLVILKYETNPYTANLLLAASNFNTKDSFVYAEGTNPLTEKVYFTSIAGTPVIVTENNEKITSQVQTLDENIRKYGLKEITIENQFITDTEFAKEIADFLIEKVADPVPILNVNIMSIPTIQLGDRIRISTMDSFDIINGDYWVISQEFSYGDGVNHSLTLRKAS